MADAPVEASDVAFPVDPATTQERLQSIQSAAAAAGAWDWDVVRKILYADGRFADLSGLVPAEALAGLPTSAFFSNVHEDDVARLRIGVAGAMHGADLFFREYRVIGAQGHMRWVAARGGVDRDDEGRVVRFKGVLVDVTEQKRIEERLAIAQSAGDVGTFEYVAGFGTVSVSEQFCRLLGLRPADALPVRTVNSVVHPHDRPLFEATGARDNYSEHRIVRADDQAPRWIARRGERRSDRHAPGVRSIGVIYDITNSKRTEMRLLELTETLEQNVRERTRERDRVWNNSRDLLAVLGPDGVIRSCNPSWIATLAHEPAALVGRTLLSLVAPDDAARAGGPVAAALTGQNLKRFEVRMASGAGGVRWISWHSVFENDAVYVYGRDVTEEKENAESLRKTEDQLRQAHKMEAVGQLTGGLAHDFNNMLTGVIGGLDIMRRRIAEGRLAGLDRYMDAAASSAQRAAALTHRLLAFSRQQTLDPKSVDVSALVGSMADMLRRTLGEQVELKVVADANVWLARTDENQLESAILNLAINARDAMPSGGTLTIETGKASLGPESADRAADLEPGDYVRVRVTDTGAGMTKDVIAKAFDPFFTTKPIGQGTGLGLSMIYGFMRQIGGHVTIDSEPGRGAAIALYLPRSVSDQPSTAIEQRAEAPRGVGETVLVVEDDDSVRLLIIEVLQELGYDAIEAADSKTAVPILRSDAKIALLISDVGLPGVSGRELAEIAREHRSDLPVLFVTGYAANAGVRADFLGPGMDLISKPFALDALAIRIRSMIET